MFQLGDRVVVSHLTAGSNEKQSVSFGSCTHPIFKQNLYFPVG